MNKTESLGPYYENFVIANNYEKNSKIYETTTSSEILIQIISENKDQRENKTINENKEIKIISKNKKKKINRKIRALQKNEDLEKIEIEKKLNLVVLQEKIFDKTYSVDMTRLGEDFRTMKFNEYEMAERHMWKRLNAFHIISDYIEEISDHLDEFDFPINKTNQFGSESYSVPISYYGLKNKNFERTHISLLNKIVVEKKDELFKLEGEISIYNKKINTNLHDFLNICDIAPKTINDIDWYVEYHLRENAYDLLRDVKKGKKGEKTAITAAILFSTFYGRCLNELHDQIRTMRDYDYEILGLPYRDEIKKMENIKNDENSLKYIDGMFGAILNFNHHFNQLKKNIEEKKGTENIE